MNMHIRLRLTNLIFSLTIKFPDWIKIHPHLKLAGFR